jgi:hypothetical protein
LSARFSATQLAQENTDWRRSMLQRLLVASPLPLRSEGTSAPLSTNWLVLVPSVSSLVRAYEPETCGSSAASAWGLDSLEALRSASASRIWGSLVLARS